MHASGCIVTRLGRRARHDSHQVVDRRVGGVELEVVEQVVHGLVRAEHEVLVADEMRAILALAPGLCQITRPRPQHPDVGLIGIAAPPTESEVTPLPVERENRAGHVAKVADEQHLLGRG